MENPTSITYWPQFVDQKWVLPSRKARKNVKDALIEVSVPARAFSISAFILQAQFGNSQPFTATPEVFREQSIRFAVQLFATGSPASCPFPRLRPGLYESVDVRVQPGQFF